MPSNTTSSTSPLHQGPRNGAPPLVSSPSLPVLPSMKPIPNSLQRRNNIVVNPFKKPIMGDIFGSNSGPERSMLGLMYRSRIEERKANIQAKFVEDQAEGESSVLGNSYNAFDVIESGSDSDSENLDKLNPKQQLAITIRNWSLIAENDDHLIQEGAVHAIIALAGVDDHLVKKCCASALYQLSSRPQNREQLLALGAASGVITLSMQVRSW